MACALCSRVARLPDDGWPFCGYSGLPDDLLQYLTRHLLIFFKHGQERTFDQQTTAFSSSLSALVDRAVPSFLTWLWSCRTYLAMKRFIPPVTFGRNAR
jgi:hypothetical protein